MLITILGALGAAFLWLLWQLLGAPLLEAGVRAGAEATGLATWIRRARFRERQMVKPAAWTIAFLTLLSGAATLGFALAMRLAPPYEVNEGMVWVAILLGGLLLLVGVVLGIRWWRITSYYLP